MPTSDRSKLYEIEEELEKNEGYARYRATEKSSKARVCLYRIELPAGSDPDRLFSDLHEYAQVRDPRAPQLIDGYVKGENEAFDFVQLEYEGSKLSSAAAIRAVESYGRDYAEELSYQTLAALAALHDQTYSHRQVTPAIYAATQGGLVFIKDNGLPLRLLKALEEETADSFGITLSSNRMTSDVAAWAATALTVISGQVLPIYDENGDLETGPVQAQSLQSALESSIKSRALREHFEKALSTFSDPSQGFENAQEALEKFPRKVLA